MSFKWSMVQHGLIYSYAPFVCLCAIFVCLAASRMSPPPATTSDGDSRRRRNSRRVHFRDFARRLFILRRCSKLKKTWDVVRFIIELSRKLVFQRTISPFLSPLFSPWSEITCSGFTPAHAYRPDHIIGFSTERTRCEAEITLVE